MLLSERLSKIADFGSISFILTLTFVIFAVKIFGNKISFAILESFQLTISGSLIDNQVPGFTVGVFIVVVLVSPFLETFVAQFLLVRLVVRIFKSTKLAIVISALLFSLAHYPAVGFFIPAFLIGVVLAWGYIVKLERKQKAFILINVVHSLHNLLIFAIHLFLPSS